LQPERFALKHGDEEGMRVSPGGRDSTREILDGMDGDLAQTRRQWIGLAVIGYAQRALASHAKSFANVDFIVAQHHL
jgi:hypothetical protein